LALPGNSVVPAPAAVERAGRASALEREPAALRVAALIDSATLSGPGRQLAAIAREVRQYGVELVVILFRRSGRPSSPLVRHLEQAGVDHVELPDHGPLDAGVARRVASALRERAPDVVQTHSYRTTAIVALLRLAGLRLPWVAFQHGATAQDAKVRFYHWLDHHLAAGAERVVVMSERHRERWPRHVPKVRVIYNAVIPAVGVPSVPESAASVGPRPVFGVVGRLSFEKGVDVFLRACDVLRKRGRAFSAVVVGDGPELDRLLALRSELGLADVVGFRPSTATVRSTYATLDALVIPSRSEGLPNVLLEALAEDLPVVSTAVGAVPEVLQDPAAGLVVPAEDPSALADAMATVADGGRTPAARRARRACVERFSLDSRARAHVVLYRELLDEWRSGAT
jgi:glycosyltransferase involved in cell wall biosynthesis